MKKYSVPALDKAMAILDLLDQTEEDLSLAEIHSRLGIPKASAFMILNVLEGYKVVRRSTEGRFTLGTKIYTLGMSYMTKMDIRKVAKKHMEDLTQKTGFTTHLGLILDQKLLFIEKVEMQSFIKFNTFPGMRSDLHITSMGKAIMAYMPEKDLHDLIDSIELGKYTPNTITDKEKLINILKRINESGYAIEDEEGELGIRCIGAPIFDINNKVIASISIVTLKSELSVDLFPQYGTLVKEAADRISSDMGYNN